LRRPAISHQRIRASSGDINCTTRSAFRWRYSGQNAVRHSLRSIGAEKAKQVLAAAEAEGKKRNWKMNIAVVDTNGELVHFLRMEGAQIASVNISIGKARTAARFRRESRVFYNAYETGHPYVSTLDPTLIASPGGFPLVEGGKLIGAIGCSGGTGDQDATICKAGADTVK
jgi:glc operon protein GlcG